MSANCQTLKPLLLIAAFASAVGTQAFATDIANAPLGVGAILPNVMFVVDDSESMTAGHMPEYVNGFYCRGGEPGIVQTQFATSNDSGPFKRFCGLSGGRALYKSSAFNKLYYDPAITYIPPRTWDDKPYPQQNSGNTAGWTSVKNDAYGVLDTTSINLVDDFPDMEWCTDDAHTECARDGNQVLPQLINGKLYSKQNPTTVKNKLDATGEALPGNMAVGDSDAPTFQPRIWGPHYYTLIPGEYCTSESLRDCQTTQTAKYYIPAPVRWCNSNANARMDTPPVGTCQALQTDVFTELRFPTKFFTSGTSKATWYGSFVRTDITSKKTYPRAPSRSDCNKDPCSYDEEMTNFANWWAYYHRRLQALKTGVSFAFAPLSDQYRMGYMSLNNATGTDFLNPATFRGTDKEAWFTKMTRTSRKVNTPLRSVLGKVGQFYGGRFNGRSLNGVTAEDPMQYSCQQNYTILATDGYWTPDNPTKLDPLAAMDDQDSGLPRPFFDGAITSTASLADVAAYYYNSDLRPDGGGSYCKNNGIDLCANKIDPITRKETDHQKMVTYTIGLGVSGYMGYQSNYETGLRGDFFDVKSGTPADPANGICQWQAAGTQCNWPEPLASKAPAIDDLWHAAVNGHGTYYSASDASGLSTGLTAALTSMQSKDGAAAAPSVSNPNLSTTDNFVFSSGFKSIDWTGEVTGSHIDPVTFAVTADWSAQALLDARLFSTRKVYTFDASGPAAPTKIKTFDWSTLTPAEQAYFEAANIVSLSQFCNGAVVCSSAANLAAAAPAAGAPLVNFLRGERNNEGTLFRQRVKVLGDIVNSEAALVQGAKFSYADTGYSDFKTAQENRKGRVYVGANDGMLHAFNAENGNEEWAYVPRAMFPSLYQLADKNYATKHRYFVDGSPVAGDVYFGGAWHTILVGGFGAGGRGFYALDVTDPANPKALWEFTYSDLGLGIDKQFTDNDLGLTMGKPEIAKLTNGTWAVIFGSGYNNVSPGNGQGHLYVLNAQTGLSIRKISTPTASSGLAHIRAWADHASIDNTAQRVYAGDELGNVWRFDINDNMGVTGYEAVPLATLRGPTGNVQPVTARPELGLAKGQVMVYVGTGRYLGNSDVGDDKKQSIYAIKDKLGSTGYGNPRLAPNKFVQQTLTNSTCPANSGNLCVLGRVSRNGSANAVNLALDDGWFVDLLEARERADTDPQLGLGTLAITTNVPDPNACLAGHSYINFFDYETGAPVATVNGIVSLRIDDLVSAVTIACGDGSVCKAVSTLKGGGTDIENFPHPPLPGGLRRTSWRELPTE